MTTIHPPQLPKPPKMIRDADSGRWVTIEKRGRKMPRAMQLEIARQIRAERIQPEYSEPLPF